jgi:NADPH:quinone reductase-like Zn-dependent oxidoreductase
MPARMKAVTLRQHGGPEVLTFEDLPTPEPGPGEVRVRVEAVALNHVDIWVRRGLPHLKLEYPFLLGADLAGIEDALGADHGINHKTQDLLAEVKRLTGRRGVDVVIEHVGEAVWSQVILATAKGGRIVTCGATSGFEAKTDLRHVFFRQLEILGSTMAPKGDLFPILDHVARGRLHPVVYRTLPLERAAEAHRILEGRGPFGKVVLTVN